MNREAVESLDKETLIRLVLSQAGTIAALTRQVEMLTTRVAELEAKLGLPPKPAPAKAGDAGQFEYSALAGTQAVGRTCGRVRQQEPAQGASRRAPAAASKSDHAARRDGVFLPAL